jgi:hypothetical protein
VIKFDSDLRQVDGFLPVLLFPPPIKMTTTVHNNEDNEKILIQKHYLFNLFKEEQKKNRKEIDISLSVYINERLRIDL